MPVVVQTTEKTVLLSDECAGGWRTAEKSAKSGGVFGAAALALLYCFVGGKMQKSDAIRIITGCAKDYNTYLNNCNLLFVFGVPENPEYFESVFLPRTFMHLTGVVPAKGKIHGSVDFYKRAVRQKLSANDFEFAANGTTEMKLQILPNLMQIYRYAKMIGEYDGSKSRLFTEKLAGGTVACLGFARDGNFYYPNTALREDIRDVSLAKPQRILMILRKPIRQQFYSEICYMAKGTDIAKVAISGELEGRIALDNLNGSEYIKDE